MKKLRKIYYRIFKIYRVIETKFVSYDEADKMIKETQNCIESERWVLSDMEDKNPIHAIVFMVYLCRKVRIME